MRIQHPSLPEDQVAETSEAAFHEVWEPRGWVPAPEQVEAIVDSVPAPIPMTLVSKASAGTVFFESGESITWPTDGAVLEVPVKFADAIRKVNAAEFAFAGEVAEKIAPPADPMAGSGAAGAFDPSAHTVDQVNEYLDGELEAGNLDQIAAVLAAEAAGKNRQGIVAGPHATVAQA